MQLAVAQADVARLRGEVAQLTAQLEEERIERIALTSSITLKVVDEIELTCVHCGQQCERAIVHRDRARDQGHTPAPYVEKLSTMRACAAAPRIPGRAA
jgi:hypothetical protein